MTFRVKLSGAAAALALVPFVVQAQENGEAEPVAVASVAIDKIVVVSSAQEAELVAGSAHYLDSEDLRRQSYVDIHRMLRDVPGVNIQEEDGFGLRPNIGLRGTGLDRSSRVTLMEDGILIAPAPYAAPAAYYFPNAGRIAGVEVVKGAGSIQYGPRTQGGAINLYSTEIPEEGRAFIDARFGDLGTRRVHAFAGDTWQGHSGIDTGLLIETFQDANDGFKELDGGGDTGYEIEDYVARLSIATKPGAATTHRLGLKAQFSDELSNETYLGLAKEDFAKNPFRRYRGSQRDEMDAQHWMVSADYYVNFNNGFDLAVIGYHTDFARDWFKLDRVDANGSDPGGAVSISKILADPGSFVDEFTVLTGEPGFVSADDALLVKHNNREYFARGVQTAIGHESDIFGLAHRIELGLRYHQDEEDRFQWFERFRMDNGTMVRTSVDPAGSDSNRIASAEALALHVQDTISWGDLTVTPGLRFESIQLKREDFDTDDPERSAPPLSIRENSVEAVIPGIGLRYVVSDALNVFAGVHKGFAPPAPGVQDAEAETAVNYEAGLRWNSPMARAEGIFFYNDFSNMLGTCTASTGGNCVIGDQFNGGEVEVTGVEFSAEANIGAWAELSVGIPVRFAYTYTSAEFRTAFESDFGPWGDVLEGDKLPYVPEHQLSAGIGVQGTRWGGDLALSWVGDVRIRTGQGPIPPAERIDARTVADLTLYWQMFDQLRLTGSVRNLFDAEYAVAHRPAGLRPGLPRVVLIGLTADF